MANWRETGRVRVLDVTTAIDSGEAVHLDGIVNQTVGAIIRSPSQTPYDPLTFDRARTICIDRASDPILRFASIPDSVAVHINGPGRLSPTCRRRPTA